MTKTTPLTEKKCAGCGEEFPLDELYEHNFNDYCEDCIGAIEYEEFNEFEEEVEE